MPRYHDYFPAPKPFKGGIKLQSQRGAIVQSWWAKRWLSILEGFGLGTRLARGKSYARSGRVLSIEIEEGRVTAEVQGSRDLPYSVEIAFNPLEKKDWKKLVAGMNGGAIAKLLSNEMPQDIEESFQAAGLNLFPQSLSELHTDCSCPDWSNPCKHVASVYLLLGEEFDRDPFLSFKLRGISREALLEILDMESPHPESVAPSDPLDADREAFWMGSDLPKGFWEPLEELEPPSHPAEILNRLGGFPFWQASKPIYEAIAPIYEGASRLSKRFTSE